MESVTSRVLVLFKSKVTEEEKSILMVCLGGLHLKGSSDSFSLKKRLQISPTTNPSLRASSEELKPERSLSNGGLTHGQHALFASFFLIKV